MAAISLKAHYDGEHILLDEPFQIPADSKLIVTVIPNDDSLGQWRDDWSRLAAKKSSIRWLKLRNSRKPSIGH